MVLEAVFNALNATGDADNVAKTVTKHSVEIAIELVKWLNCQRFDLMGETGPQVPNEVLHGDSIDVSKTVSLLLNSIFESSFTVCIV